MKRTLLHFHIFFLFTTFSLHALPVETGVSIYSGMADAGGFKTGVDLFQARYYSLPEVRLNDGQAFRRANFYETYLRFLDVLDEGHHMGFGLGMLDIPAFRVREISTGGNAFDSLWRLNGEYLYMDYRYSTPESRLWKLRNVFFEAGGSLGILPSVRWKVDGAEVRYGTLDEFHASQKSDLGFLYRLEGGAGIRVRGNMILRTGFYASYLSASGFDGNVRGADGGWYTLSGGGMVPMSITSLETLGVQMESGALDALYLESIKGKTELNASFSGIYFSVGIRL